MIALNLTPRQEEIAHLVAEGKPNKEISRALGLSEHTTRRHLQDIYDRVGVANRTQLAIAVIERERFRRMLHPA